MTTGGANGTVSSRNRPVCDELCLLQQCPEVSFGCDIFVFDVVFKLSLSLLYEPHI